MNGADTVHGADSQVGQLLRDRFRPVEAKRIARTGEPGLCADDRLFECGRHTSGHLVRPSGSLQKPRRPSLAIPPDPFVHPLPTALQSLGNPTDRPPLQPPAGTSLAFFDQPRTFFDSYPIPLMDWRIFLPFFRSRPTVNDVLSVWVSTMSCHVTFSPVTCMRKSA